MGATRNVHPKLRGPRATLGTLVRDGRHEEAEQVRRELAEAKFQIDIERAVDAFEAKAGPIDDNLSPAKVDALGILLGGAR